MGSLQGFQVLRKIRVEYRMFVETGSKESTSSLRTRRMRDVLPVSAESVKLTGPMLGYKNMAELVEGLGEHKGMGDIMLKPIPRLETVFYESCKPLTKPERIRKLFTKVRGIVFNLKQVTI